jgi:hypothetical protein
MDKKRWEGVAPSPAIVGSLDEEEAKVLALLAWSVAVHQPVTSTDLANIKDRNGEPIGIDDARSIVADLMEMRLTSVLGMRNENPLSIFLGGFRPKPGSPTFSRPETRRSPVRSRTAPAPRPGTPAKAAPANFKAVRIDKGLMSTPNTPDFVVKAAEKLKTDFVKVRDPEAALSRVQRAEEHLRIMEARIALYEHWLTTEDRPDIRDAIEQKRASLPTLKKQLEQAREKSVTS